MARPELIPHIVPSLHDLLHPLEGLGYQFWSGIGSDFGQVTLITTLIAGIVTFWVKHNCHEHGCLRLSWHPDEDGHPVCKKHHEDHPSLGWFRSDKTHPRHRKAKAAARANGSEPPSSAPQQDHRRAS